MQTTNARFAEANRAFEKNTPRNCRLPARRRKQIVTAHDDHELVAPALLPAALAFIGAGALLLTIAGDVDARFCNAAVGEILPRDLRATHAERDVVLVRPAVVGVPLDANSHIR